jgi:hypothetical protein
MSKGPHEMRLDTYVVGGSVATIRHSAQVWTHGQQVLERLATALDTVRPQLMDKFGPQTGPAAAAAFEKVAGNVRDQAAEMQRASGALTTAADALQDAQTTHERLGNAPASPPPDATQKAGETAESFHLRQRDVTAAQGHYAAESAQREQQSQLATHTVDTKYTHAIKVMESIHGQPARPHPNAAGAGGSGVPSGSAPAAAGTSGGTTATPWQITGGGVPGGGHTGGQSATGPTHDSSGHDPSSTPEVSAGSPSAPPGYGDPGIPQGPGSSDPGVVTQPGGSVPMAPGGHVPLGPSATSTATGTLLSGGIVGGTTGLSNVLRTGAVAPSSIAQQATLAASRTSAVSEVIVTTGTTGTSATTGTTATSAASARGGAVGMTGGSRGAARGAGIGAGGRGPGNKRRRRPGTEFYEDNEDWLDDDEASPGVLD